MEYYLAVDIGASSGRHILFWRDRGKFYMEEIHRFDNGLKDRDGEMCWDLTKLFTEVREGLKKCKALGKIPSSMGVDTWAVDFVLLNKNNEIIGNAVGYRDQRTRNCDRLVYDVISEEQLYYRTGIQKQIFNTIYQLKAIQSKHPEQLLEASSFLMIPDYFHFLLTGKKAVEYTNATTTQLVSPITYDWDYELIEKLGYPSKIFGEIKMAGEVLGTFTEEIVREVGFQCQVVLPATHDTGSAVLAVPSKEEHTIYISSGTWSLMGVEREQADCSLGSKEHNFTNEGGYEKRFRYLKNIMGLWMIQQVKQEIGSHYTFHEICEMAAKEKIQSVVDCNDQRFLTPKSMVNEIKAACFETGQQIPEGIATIAAVIYHSLAICYKNTVEEIEELTGIVYDCIHIIGGGANAEYLNYLTAKATGKTVYAGPTEATAIGNALAQMICTQNVTNVKEARQLVRDSFEIKEI